MIFAPNHHSHLDTGLMIRAVPSAWRHKLVVAAAADYFFDKKWKAALSALSLNAIPIDRELTGRKSSDLIKGLIDDGYSLVIYPEGGRSPDGWGQDFKGGAAYLSARTGAPVVPVFIDGTGAIFGKGMKRPKPGRTKVVFGAPMRPDDDESTRRFNARIEAAVTMLGDEAITDFWTRPAARRRRAPTRRSPARSTPDGDAIGRSPNGDSSAPPVSAAASNAAGPTSAERRAAAAMSEMTGRSLIAGNPVRAARRSCGCFPRGRRPGGTVTEVRHPLQHARNLVEPAEVGPHVGDGREDRADLGAGVDGPPEREDARAQRR